MLTIQKAYRTMDRFSSLAQKALEFIVAILVLTCAGDLFLQVVNRYIIVKVANISITWTTEYAQDAIIWITYLAIGICYKENSMASVNFIYDRLKGRWKFALYCLTRIIMVLFLIVGFKYGWDAIKSVSNWHSTTLHLPGWTLYSAPFIGCVLIAYETLTEFLGVVCGDIKPFDGRPPKPSEEPDISAEEQALIDEIEREQQS